jgi:hypothetical protein
MRKLFGALVFASLIAAPVAARAQGDGRDASTWAWDGRMSSGNTFRLSSINGPVSIESSSDNMVHVRAEKIVNRGNVTDVHFQVIQSGGDVHVCALWQQDSCDDDGMHSHRNRDDDEDHHDVRVKFTVRVPAGVRVIAGTVNGEMRVHDVSSDVNAMTVNGLVEVTNVGGEVRANTVNGRVDVSTRSGPVRANTVNGDINVRMGSLARDGEMDFHTVNGSITVETPPSLDADVSLDTMHGSIMSDWPVQLTGRFGPRHAEGIIGRGGRSIRLRTLNGSVELRKSRS